MKEKRSSFVRLWGYLKAYRFAVIFATLLKILSVVMSVIEPYILGLAITELTANLTDMARLMRAMLAGSWLSISSVESCMNSALIIRITS